MIAITGALFLFLGCSSIGFLKARELKNDHILTIDFMQALAYAQREITQNHRSLPDILLTLREKEYTTVGGYFKKLHDSLEENSSFREKWDESILFQKELPESLLQIIQPLGGVLGQYDSEKQGDTIARILVQLEVLSVTQEAESVRLSKVYVVSGITLGLFLVILLL